MSFARYYEIETQLLPQCCKYLNNKLMLYHLYLKGVNVVEPVNVVKTNVKVNYEGFIQMYNKIVVFDFKYLHQTNPNEINDYIDVEKKHLSGHDANMLKLLAQDRWAKSDFVRLYKILTQSNVKNLINFACNTLWERGYENHYTLGQQLSIRITTKLIQSGLDFKHQTGQEEKQTLSRGWHNAPFEKFVNSITSISDVIKRHRYYKKYIVLELSPGQKCKQLIEYFKNHFTIIENRNAFNLCAIEIEDDKNSLLYMKKFANLIDEKIVNVLFVTDVEYYMKTNNYMFYLYNSLKLYYYCLTNKFVFERKDYEIIFLINIIVSLEWHNNGHLNSFTLEKSIIYNPLELSTRRLNSIKRAATQSRTLSNDSEIKMDFIKGKRMKTGTHYGHRMIGL
ncbi:p47 [Ectropis obliqua nucleopolyhedrovirus]|uniref:p47 n=1 Tax=Ectropis obliqua nucleopolyhedrovirus TaxID=59376 RepID=A0EYT2_9ABAC|nr:p47 [Ectropis obliqua nucleopolyhedrovirus]ABI35713.1 p47 [Ectropis obliqua nucleopolyhedrovirus]AGS47890.1 viral transcription regulator p47 [Ectropis obliqua nucleopolyhedrovirus]QWV59615.1 p47 [Ectropis obliqua nucleopolyhedrovirus]UYO72821.1 p47 [Ectropis obliqua nucleopolyhedrovirus]